MSESFNFLASGSFGLLSFVVALSIIVFIHEFGHYIIGRWCGIKAEVFSIGFGPVLVSKTDKQGTKWQIALLPLGGFVKFLKDEDVSGDLYKSFGTFDGASVLSRILTVLAGPMANFILSFVILVIFVLVNGISSDKIQIKRIIDYPFENQNLIENDKILSVNGEVVNNLTDYYKLLEVPLLKNDVTYTVERSGKVLMVTGPHPFPAIVGSVSLRSAASASGLMKGDLILEVNETQIFRFSQLQSYVADTNDYPLNLKIWRDGKILQISVTPKIVDYPDSSGKFVQRKLIGITGGSFFELKRENANVFEAANIAISQIISIISGSLNGLKNIIIGAISTCNLQGPIGIASTTSEAAQQGLASFVWIIAVLSTAIGLLNLFPIPMLDGGHLIFFGIEALTGRKPTEKIIQAMSIFGILILFGLMSIALSSDLFCP